MKRIYVFTSCRHCDAPVQEWEVDVAPTEYEYCEEYEDAVFYCIGSANRSASCTACGAGYEW